MVHLAAATNVAASWGAGFAEHAASVLSTQRLLDSCAREGVTRVVVASSSHVYGSVAGGLAREDLPVEPTSPYGVAKLAAEGLVVVPRLFTAALTGQPMPLYGDGTALHTWTYVSDLVEATIRATVVRMAAGQAVVVNAAGPDQASLLQVADQVGAIVGGPVPLQPAGDRAGDAAGTRAELTRAHQLLGFTPTVGLNQGLLRQWRHMTRAGYSASATGGELAMPGASART